MPYHIRSYIICLRIYIWLRPHYFTVTIWKYHTYTVHTCTYLFLFVCLSDKVYVVFCRIRNSLFNRKNRRKSFNSRGHAWHKIHSTRTVFQVSVKKKRKTWFMSMCGQLCRVLGPHPGLIMTRARPGRLYLRLWCFNLWSVYTLRC